MRKKDDFFNQTDEKLPKLSIRLSVKNKYKDIHFIVMKNLEKIYDETYCHKSYSAAIAHANQIVNFDYYGKAKVTWCDEIRNTKTLEEAMRAIATSSDTPDNQLEETKNA